CGEVRQERRGYVDRLARDGMVEGESRRVEKLPLEPQIARDAVERITGDGEVDRGEMHADLVRTAGLQSDAQECALRQELVELEVRHGGARLGGVERVPMPVVPVAADRGVGSPAAGQRVPDDGPTVVT